MRNIALASVLFFASTVNAAEVLVQGKLEPLTVDQVSTMLQAFGGCWEHADEADELCLAHDSASQPVLRMADLSNTLVPQTCVPVDAQLTATQTFVSSLTAVPFARVQSVCVRQTVGVWVLRTFWYSAELNADELATRRAAGEELPSVVVAVPPALLGPTPVPQPDEPSAAPPTTEPETPSEPSP